MVSLGHNELTQGSLVMLYGDIDGPTMAQVMACCLMAQSHYLNWCWLFISKVQRRSSGGNLTRYPSHQLLKLAWNYFTKISLKSARGQWVNWVSRWYWMSWPRSVQYCEYIDLQAKWSDFRGKRWQVQDNRKLFRFTSYLIRYQPL